MSGDFGKIDFNPKKNVLPEISEKASKVLKGIAAFVGTGLAIGVILRVIEAIGGAGTLASAFSAAGSSISAALAAAGPFLASAFTTLGAITAAHPIAAALIVGGAIVLAAVIIVAIVVVKNSPTSQIKYLLQKKSLTFREENTLRNYLMTLAKRGNIDALLNATKGQILDGMILFVQDEDSKKTLISYLVEQQIPDCLKLCDDKDKGDLKKYIVNNIMYHHMVEMELCDCPEGYHSIDLKSDLFLLHLAVIDFKFAKSIAEKLETYALFGKIQHNLISCQNLQEVENKVDIERVTDDDPHLKACAQILKNV